MSDTCSMKEDLEDEPHRPAAEQRQLALPVVGDVLAVDDDAAGRR